MNPIVYLQRRFGSKETKIKAIQFDIKKLQDEIKYLSSQLDAVDENKDDYLSEQITNLQYVINSNQLEIERLQI